MVESLPTYTEKQIQNQSVPRRAEGVSLSDTVDLPNAGQLYVGTGGDVVVIPEGQTNEVTLSNVPDGTFLPPIVKRVLTSTTASDILVWY
jgi:hypothetical protein